MSTRSTVLPGVVFALVGCATTQPSASAPFETTLARHMAAIEARDIDGIIGTVTKEPALVLIFPNGSSTATREEYLAFHRKWFADPAWRMSVEPVRIWQGRDYGYALYRSLYDPDGTGPSPARPSWLSLGFRLENGEWRLVHDQNTRIDAPSQ